MEKAALEAHIQLPKSYYLVDIPLLQIEFADDMKRLKTEIDFFNQHPELGHIQVWGTSGTDLSLLDKNIFSAKEYLANNLDLWLKDQLLFRVNQLHKWLIYNNGKLPTVYYVHCYGGCDRTGELIGAYTLRFLNKSWEEVNTINHEHCGRPFGCNNYHATQWYCQWLKQNLNVALQCEKELGCNKIT